MLERHDQVEYYNGKSFGKKKNYTARKVSKYGVLSGSYFPVFSPNTGKYRPEKTPYLVTFHAVLKLKK